MSLTVRLEVVAYHRCQNAGGIGFTMSIFITNLAFSEYPATVNAATMSTLLASLAAVTIGFLLIKLTYKSQL